MPNEEDFTKLWKNMKTLFPEEPEEKVSVYFGAEVLNNWGWPYKPISVKKSMPPINQSFLGYFPGTGWLLDFWKDGYVPYAEDMPTHWLSINVLPDPNSFREQS
jgi:hypothetical protein